MRKPEPIIEQPNREDWIRLAAFIDGEGCIHAKGSQKPRRAGWGSHYKAYVKVSNTDPRLMVWLKATFGGSVSPVKTPKRHSRHVLFNWEVAGGRCDWVLQNCLEFFLLKRHQAEIVLAFRETFPKVNAGVGKVLPAVIERREALIRQLKDERYAFAEVVVQ